MNFRMFSDNTDEMRRELTDAGLAELRTAESVKGALDSPGNTLIAVNSICGCAASVMRPAVVTAVKAAPKNTKLFTVFAGQDREATEEARRHFTNQPPSSPCVALLKDGKLVYMLPRESIQGRSSSEVANDLITAFKNHWP